MGGITKISTTGPIKKAPPFPYLRSKAGTSSEASPLFSGKMYPALESLFPTLIPSSSTLLPPAYSKGVKTRGSCAILEMVLRLHHQLIKTLSYVHIGSHLMVKNTVEQFQLALVIISVIQIRSTC
jgi:hypothetical protein